MTRTNGEITCKAAWDWRPGRRMRSDTWIHADSGPGWVSECLSGFVGFTWIGMSAQSGPEARVSRPVTIFRPVMSAELAAPDRA
jgi:hypothetical protein